MANHKSAIKRHRQSLKRRERNRAYRSSCRTAIKKTIRLVEEFKAGNVKADEVSTAFAAAQKIVDSAANKKIYHRANASRKISRLQEKVNKALA